VQTIFGTFDLLVLVMKISVVAEWLPLGKRTLPPEIDSIQKPIYFKTAQLKDTRNKKIVVKNVLGSFYSDARR